MEPTEGNILSENFYLNVPNFNMVKTQSKADWIRLHEVSNIYFITTFFLALLLVAALANVSISCGKTMKPQLAAKDTESGSTGPFSPDDVASTGSEKVSDLSVNKAKCGNMVFLWLRGGFGICSAY